MLDEAGWSRPVSMNRRDLDHLERRELQLTIMAAAVVFILAGALALFMYPLVFIHPDENNKWTLRVAFFGFCVLTLLFVAYLFDRQRTVAKLKQQIIGELERNIELRVQACADLLQTMPDVNHFWDRLAMEYRRAMTTQRTLSLLLVKVKPGPRSLDEADNAKAWSEAAKGMTRRLRPTDSIYRLAPNLFGIVLPQTDTTNANRVAMRLQAELQDVSLRHGFSFTTSVHNYPEHVNSSHELEDIVRSLLPETVESDLPVSTR
jgi:GGDEF domain-containing protein